MSTCASARVGKMLFFGPLAIGRTFVWVALWFEKKSAFMFMIVNVCLCNGHFLCSVKFARYLKLFKSQLRASPH